MVNVSVLCEGGVESKRLLNTSLLIKEIRCRKNIAAANAALVPRLFQFAHTVEVNQGRLAMVLGNQVPKVSQ